ncbi:MAG: glycosyltransferase family 4 protein [Bacteroidales bacterium]|nr:glycosyltransferase family 4 protein [Bacteroidales bacterium]
MRVLILYNKLFHYRIPVWNVLASHCDLTVAYTQGDDSITKEIPCQFKTMHLPAKTFARRFLIHKDNIRKLAKEYDVIVAYGDIAWLKYSTLPWDKNTKVVFHTLGVSANYNKGYDEYKKWDKVRAYFYRRAKALAFYTDYPIAKYVKLGIPEEKMFVAPNTVSVQPLKEEREKKSILMIGTLYREKGIQLLLDAYLSLKDSVKLPVLKIVGNGPDYEIIKSWIAKHDMSHLISLEGAVYDISKKAEYFAEAIACISPKQAGLTVLESMGYGVPFITWAKAITGGEMLNIHNGKDGVIFEEDSDLVNIVRDISTNPSIYIGMGREAKKFYDENRTIHHMAQGLWDAIQYAYDS